MELSIWMTLIIITFVVPPLIALILCLALIKNKSYKKLTKKNVYAGFWYRFLAGLIDYIILSVVSFILVFIPIIGWILSIPLYWLYFAVQHSSSKKATIGMRACDIIITDENHNKVSFWRATGNYFVSALSAMFLFIGFFMIAFTGRKQGFHNIISRTLCTKVR